MSRIAAAMNLPPTLTPLPSASPHRLGVVADLATSELRYALTAVSRIGSDGDGPIVAHLVDEPDPAVLVRLADAGDETEPAYGDDEHIAWADIHRDGAPVRLVWAKRCDHCTEPLPESGSCGCDAARAEARWAA